MADESRSADAIFDEAIQRAAGAARVAFLDEACAGQPTLRQRVEVLLQAHEEAGSFLEAPALNSPPTIIREVTEQPGDTIGPYKLLQQIGEGGMGVVYMAEQTEPVERRVALKIIKPGMDTQQVIARFEAERQALAMMDHPNIAKVLDAGTTDSGRPYFVMELVKGMPVTQYCDEQHLTPRERLELFLPICQAVQHAHQKGIIHRDLKPSNILVAQYDNKPVPKVIDFGVAKAVSHKLTEKTMFTQYGQIVGTIEYMSPEQARFNQLDVDTRSDIYSLGVLLYELLTGETPFDKTRLRSAAFDELLRIIREEEPPKPSTKLSSSESLANTAVNRKMEPNKLSLLVRGDLDWIVMKALEKDRNRRYETATSFAADIQHYLNDEPVTACPPSAAYKIRKFTRRNKAVIGTAMTIAISLIAGVIGTTWEAIEAEMARDRAVKAERVAEERLDLVTHQKDEIAAEKQRAEMNFRRAREAVDRLFTQVADDLRWEPHMEQNRRELLESALEFYRKFLDQKGDDPEIRLETAYAQGRVGDVYAQLGKVLEATEAYEKYHALLQALNAEFKDDERYQDLLAASFLNLAHRMNSAYQLKRSDAYFSQSWSIWSALAKTHPTNPEYRLQLVKWYAYRAGSYGLVRKRHLEQQRLLRRALAELDDIEAEFPDAPPQRRMRSNCLYALSKSLTEIGRLDQAEQVFQKAALLEEQIFREMGREPPRVNWTTIKSDISRAMRQNRPGEAEFLSRTAIAHYEELVKNFPDTEVYAKNLKDFLSQLSGALAVMGRWDEAEEVTRKQLELNQNGHWARYNLATIQFAAEKYQDAAENFKQALAVFESEAVKHPEIPRVLGHLAIVLATCPDKEFRDSRRAISIARKVLEISPDSPDGWQVLGYAQVGAGDDQSALESFAEARRLAGGKLEDTVEQQIFTALAYWHLGEHEKGRQLFEKVVPDSNKSPVHYAFCKEIAQIMGITLPEAPKTLEEFVNAAQNSLRHDDLEQAAKYFQQSIDLLNNPKLDPANELTRVIYTTLADNEPLRRLVIQGSHDAETIWKSLAHHYCRTAQWQKAAFCFSQMKVGFYSPEATNYARVLVLAGDAEKYREFCLSMHRQVESPKPGNIAFTMIAICTVGANSGIDPQEMLKWMQQSREAAPPNSLWVAGLSPIVQYRTGQFEKVVSKEPREPGTHAFVWACAHHQLGNKAQSQEWFQTGIKQYREQLNAARNGYSTWAFGHWLNASAWYFQTAQLLEDDPLEMLPQESTPAAAK